MGVCMSNDPAFMPETTTIAPPKKRPIRTGTLDERTKSILTKLQNIPILQMLNENQKLEVAHNLEERKFQPGESLMHEGQQGTEFFLILAGKCEVFVGKQKVSELQANDYCGEQALLNPNAKRTATVKAIEPVDCLVMERDNFQDVVRASNLKFHTRKMHLALTQDDNDSDGPEEDESVVLQNQSLIEWLVSCVEKNMLFSDMQRHEIEDIVKYMTKLDINAGQNIITQDDSKEVVTKEDQFFVIQEGIFEVEKEKKVIDTISKGACVGELALVFNAPRTATVRATTNGSVYALTRYRYRAAANQIRRSDDDAKIAFLRKIPLLGSLYNSEITILSRALERVEYPAGDTIFHQGDEGDKFYIIMSGEMIGRENRSDGTQKEFQLSESEWFGELALRYNKPRTATIVAKTDVVLLEITRKDFNTLFGSLEEIMERQIEEYQRPIQSDKAYRKSLLKRSLEDLERGPMVGRGKYGAVQFVHDPVGKTTYALKMVAKSWVNSRKVKQSKRRIASLFNERNIMREFSSHNCPFLVKLRGTFKDDVWVYFLLEAAQGGDFFNVLKTRGSVNEKTAQFYCACLIEGLAHLHSLGMIHRDLKPENIVLDHRGYGMLTDFGFTKKLGPSNKTYTLCGTPGYMAPEVILGQGYGKAADWFSLGCVLYDMVTGAPPFPTRADQFTMIRQMMQNKLHLPMYLSFWIKDLICHLLKLKTVKRLGVIQGGVGRIRSHQWFHGFDWDALRAGTLKAPIKPKLSGQMDASNFDKTCLEQQPMQTKSNATLAAELANWDVSF